MVVGLDFCHRMVRGVPGGSIRRAAHAQRLPDVRAPQPGSKTMRCRRHAGAGPGIPCRTRAAAHHGCPKDVVRPPPRAASALTAVHQGCAPPRPPPQGVANRDLKLENLLLDQDQASGNPLLKICDFGGRGGPPPACC